MGATAQERLIKRRLNELEQRVRKIMREIDKLKTFRKVMRRSQKHELRALQREEDLRDLLDEIEAGKFDQALDMTTKEASDNDFECRKPECRSKNVSHFEAGMFKIIVCEDCGGRYTLRLNLNPDVN